MNAVTKTTTGGRSEADEAARVKLTGKIEAIRVRNGWTKSSLAKKLGIAESTCHQYMSGNYLGRLDELNQKARNWLDGFDEMQRVTKSVPKGPALVHTETVKHLLELIVGAHAMPALNIATCATGLGKTATAEHYVASNANCWLVKLNESTGKTFGMLNAIKRAVGIKNGNYADLVYDIGERIERREAPTCLILDEAQHLTDDAINQVRFFLDAYKCGIVLLGNTASRNRPSQWGESDGHAQLLSRVFQQYHQERPSVADLERYIHAWDITAPDQVEFLTGVGKKSGAYRLIEQTVSAAHVVALGAGRGIEIGDLRAGWKRRDLTVQS